MKTILITIFQAVEAKNILRTGVYLELLRHEDVKLILLVRTPERREYYAGEFNHPRVEYAVVNYHPAGLADRFFSWLKFHLLKTASNDMRRRHRLIESGNYFSFALNFMANRLLARRSIRGMARWLDARLTATKELAALLESCKPSVVFLANLFDDIEAALLREAGRRGIPTVGLVNSWDKMTSRCIMRLRPDKLLVYNEVVWQEAMEHADMPKERIIPVGIPQYDIYHDYLPAPRQEFFRRINADPKKRLIVYAPIGREFSESDWNMIDLLQDWIEARSLPSDVEILIRFQPNDFFDEAEFKKRPRLRYNWPGVRFSSERGGDWDMTGKEIKHLADTLAHMELLICYASSLSVDAAIFDKPVINIGFEIVPSRLPSKTPSELYRLTHYRKALQSGGIRLARSQDELLSWIHRYFNDPSLDRQGRAKLVRMQCWRNDGMAGQRIAMAIFVSANSDS